MIRRSFLILLLCLPLLAFGLHKYYVSMCEIEYVESSESMQFIFGLFIDDLELTLEKETGLELRLDSSDEYVKTDSLFNAYLNTHFSIKINDQKKQFDYIGKEYDFDIVRFYLEITDVKQLNSLEIKNTCLFKYFEDQRHIVKLNFRNRHKTLYLSKKNDKGLLKL